MKHAKFVGSFSGPLRNNIVRMLDSVGVHDVLGVPTCASLFDAAHEQVHFTSALRYPVFLDGANYNGNPDLLRTPFLRQMVETFLAAEARALPGALWPPSVQNRPLRYGASSRFVYFQRTVSWKACRTRAALTPSASSSS